MAKHIDTGLDSAGDGRVTLRGRSSAVRIKSRRRLADVTLLPTKPQGAARAGETNPVRGPRLRKKPLYRIACLPCTSDRGLWDALGRITDAAMVRKVLKVSAQLGDASIAVGKAIPSASTSDGDVYEVLVWVSVRRDGPDRTSFEMPEASDLSAASDIRDLALREFADMFKETMVLGYLQDTRFVDRREVEHRRDYKGTVWGVARIEVRFGHVIDPGEEGIADPA